VASSGISLLSSNLLPCNSSPIVIEIESIKDLKGPIIFFNSSRKFGTSSTTLIYKVKIGPNLFLISSRTTNSSDVIGDEVIGSTDVGVGGDVGTAENVGSVVVGAEENVGEEVLGAEVVGSPVTNVEVVGTEVVGTEVMGAGVVGEEVFVVVGTEVVGADVVGTEVDAILDVGISDSWADGILDG